MDINVVLQSTMLGAIVSAIIAGVVSVLNSRKDQRLHYITDERRAWREKIREIAGALNGADRKETINILSELKVRINAFGMEDKADYAKDAHIWELIKDIEDNDKGSRNELHEKQSLLIKYLSLLLKFDWERSKKEVNVNSLEFAGILIYIVTGLAFAYYFVTYNVYELPNVQCIFYMITIIAVTVAGNIICLKILDKIVESTQNCNKNTNPDKYKGHRMGWCYAVLIICNSVMIWAFISISKQLFWIKDVKRYACGKGILLNAARDIASQMKLAVMIMSILYICANVFYSMSKLSMINLRHDYINAVNALKKSEK